MSLSSQLLLEDTLIAQLRLKSCQVPIRPTPHLMEPSSDRKKTINIKLDESWRQDMAGKRIADNLELIDKKEETDGDAAQEIVAKVVKEAVAESLIE